MRLFQRTLPLIPLLLSLPLAHAQSSFDLNIGFGSVHNGANGGGIDNANSILNPFGSCTPNAGDPNCQATPGLSNFFLGLGGDLMLFKHLGVGAEVSFMPARADYGPLQFRQTFYDFNGIYAPINEKRVQLQLQGGIGGAKTGFSFFQNQCVGIAVCSAVNTPVGNSNHFQIHAGIGVQIFVTEHIFIRPQFDLHYVPNFTDQFNSTVAPGAMIWVGYSFGDRS